MEQLIERKLAALKDMTPTQLRERYAELYGESPGSAASRCLRAVLNSSPMSPRCKRKTRQSYRALCGSMLRLRLEAARPFRALTAMAKTSWM